MGESRCSNTCRHSTVVACRNASLVRFPDFQPCWVLFVYVARLPEINTHAETQKAKFMKFKSREIKSSIHIPYCKVIYWPVEWFLISLVLENDFECI